MRTGPERRRGSARRGTERKVVTVLFSDLVGFTSNATSCSLRTTVAGRRSPRWSGERTENCTGQEELEVCWEAARAVPTAVEELASPGTQGREDVLEVRSRARRRAQRRRIERAASHGEEGEAREAAAYLEAA